MNTAILFIVSLFSSVCSQYWQKRTALYLSRHPGLSLWQKALCTPLLLSIFFLLLGALSWLYVLHDWSVSTAYPLLSLNFILVLLLSHYSFGEVLSPHQWTGCGFILLGIILVVASTT